MFNFRFAHHETNKVDYTDLLEYLNYTTNPTSGSQGLSKVTFSTVQNNKRK